MLAKWSGAEVIECQPDLVLNLAFTCLCSSFIAMMVPSSSVTVVFVHEYPEDVLLRAGELRADDKIDFRSLL